MPVLSSSSSIPFSSVVASRVSCAPFLISDLSRQFLLNLLEDLSRIGDLYCHKLPIRLSDDAFSKIFSSTSCSNSCPRLVL